MLHTLRLIFRHPQYFGVAWVFASLNILFGTWAIYIPIVQEKLKIGKSELGFAIFFLSLGIFFVFPLAPKIINKIGAGKVTALGAIASCFIIFLPLAANHYYLLMLGLFLLGVINGFTDIAMNVLVVEIEKRDQIKFMSSAHGFFSLGGIFAGLGSFLIGPIGNPLIHIGIVSVVVLVVNLFFIKHYLPITSQPPKQDTRQKKSTNWTPLLFLFVISFIAMGSEGAIIDWSGIYLKEVTLAPKQWWGIGFLAFQISMTLGRFCGDSLNKKYSSFQILTVATLLVIVGYALVLSSITTWAILGLFICGLGFSVMVPEVFRICGNQKQIEVSKSIALIAGAGYTGFLVTPPVLGVLSDAYSLKASFVLLLGAATLILFTTFILEKIPSD